LYLLDVFLEKKNGTGLATYISEKIVFLGEEKKMKLRRFKTTAVLIGLSLIVFASCGKKNATPNMLGIGASGYGTGACTASATGDNVYTGDIVDNYSGTTGKVVLTVSATGGAVYGQVMASAYAEINGATFCCTSSGMGVIGKGRVAGEKATMADFPLTCQGSSTDPTFGGYYQSVILKIGVFCPGGWTEAVLSTDNRLKGCVQLTSGIQSYADTYFVK